MPVIQSRVNARSQAFLDNATAMQAQVDDLKRQLERTAQGGSE
jgi:3-methylcrotonyl-CoA carboxylase beta subunit